MYVCMYVFMYVFKYLNVWVAYTMHIWLQANLILQRIYGCLYACTVGSTFESLCGGVVHGKSVRCYIFGHFISKFETSGRQLSLHVLYPLRLFHGEERMYVSVEIFDLKCFQVVDTWASRSSTEVPPWQRVWFSCASLIYWTYITLQNKSQG